jgi:CubicO group peptidase (beta-lactamase class C family)
MKNYTSLLLLLCSLSFSSSAQTVNKAKLDSLFTALATNDKAMGSLTLSQNGVVVYSRAIGYEAIGATAKTPATTATRYRVGSVSKVFTATMAFQLIDEGKLTLTTPLATYFPELPNAKRITIGNLLNQRSGLHNFTADATYQTYLTQPQTQAEMVKLIGQSKPDFEPNARFGYSNSNYVLLGYIIEKITKHTYNQALQQRIAAKANLKDTYYGGKIDAKRHESASYRFAGYWQPSTETDMSIPGGAGAVVSTPADLARFIEALFAGKLVSEKSLSQMKTMTDGYGYGLMQFPLGSKRAYGHNGGIDEFSSSLAYFPDDKLAVAFCSNGLAYPMNDILLGALSIYFGAPYRIPDFKAAAIKLSAAELTQYAGTYASLKMPLKITVTANGSALQAQATGQPAFQLTPAGKDAFTFDQAGVRMEFAPARQELLLKQGGGTFLFTRE